MPDKIPLSLSLRRLIILALPISYYFFSRQQLIFAGVLFIAAVLFFIYLKNYLKIEIRPKFLREIFTPEAEFIFLTLGCLLSIFFFPRVIALNVMLCIILGNTFADIAKARYGRLGEALTFAYISLSLSLFLLFFPLVFDWHIAILGCFSGVVIRMINLPFNRDISVAFASGLTMTLLLFA